MPTTLLGLVFFILLLAPGLSYSAYRSANAPVVKPSAFRELSAVALRSALWDAVALAFFGIVRVIAPRHTPDVGQLSRTPSAYLEAHAAYVFWWSIALIAVACALAIGGALLTGRATSKGWTARIPLSWFAPRGDVSANPAWWVLFTQHPDKQVYVGIVLDDGTYLAGWVLSFSPDSDETADRELTLSGPITVRAPSATETSDLGVGAVAISSRRIQYLTVSYVDPPPPDES